MSRELRRVPVDYEWPTEEAERLVVADNPSLDDFRQAFANARMRTVTEFVSMLDETLADAQAQWDREKAKWDRGERPEYATETMSFDEWSGDRPDDATGYRPEWPADAVLGYVVCQTISEGTPVTPIFATQKELVEHLVRVGTQVLPEGRPCDPPMSRNAAERFVYGTGWVPSGIVGEKGVRVGLALMEDDDAA